MIKIIDLFVGAGGLSLGLKKAGFEIVAGLDNWDDVLKVYNKNFDHDIIKQDLSNVEESVKVIEDYDFDMIVGGPPCQDFSSAGKRDESLGRADLTIDFANIIANLKPKYILMENVERVEKSMAFQEAKSIIKESGYGISTFVLDASYANVPQKRKRFFMFGELNGEDNSLNYIVESNLNEKPMTMRDYFGDSLGIDHYYRHPRNYNRRGVFSMDEPSPTIRGVNRPVPKGYKGNKGDTAPYTEVRPLTAEERGMVQTFPRDYFNGVDLTKTSLEQMVGNAVPVNLANYVGECIKKYLHDVENGTLITADNQLSLF